jgi:hypothetical protein
LFEKVNGPNSTAAAPAMHSSAVLRNRCGKYAEAEQFERRALAIV